MIAFSQPLTTRTIITMGLLLLVLVVTWPLTGAIALYQQYARTVGEDTAALNRWLHDVPYRITAGDSELQLLPVPRIHLHNIIVQLPDHPEPIEVASATISAHWYSPWVYHWRPNSLHIEQGTWLAEASFPEPGTWQDMNDAPNLAGTKTLNEQSWAIADTLTHATILPADLNALTLNQLVITLYDPASEQVLDLTYSGTLRRTRQNGYELQGQADLSGNSWLDRGFWTLAGRWTPTSADNQLLLHSLDSELQFSASSHEYGEFQWQVEAENVRINSQQQTLSAEYLILGQGQQAGQARAPNQEAGFRVALQSLQWRADEPFWRAQHIQAAAAERPHDPHIADIRWLMEGEHWRTSGTEQVGRTQLTWEINFQEQTLEQVQLQMAQGGGLAPQLTHWQADNAEITLIARSHAHQHRLTGWAAVDSNLATQSVQLTGAELTEQRHDGDSSNESDAVWLYADAEAQPGSLTLSDVSGTLQGSPSARSDGWQAWLDCYDTWTPLLAAVITHCAQPQGTD